MKDFINRAAMFLVIVLALFLAVAVVIEDGDPATREQSLETVTELIFLLDEL